ncbi:hypothetical protein CYLTODRAFT_458196 [Cylindrobasidium torrendii FP15055 ss-10]|uniref:Mid2 domain-containing protein n=1 Tax=Cylindrobasidium torrendii FP15055 ss-10 TaxID=1314674 RepID=A0A0D7AZG0_9AGAR|nr:hypothetical protein CYLTODRAFT_458196 [Cylindrobasidium torrendii FP15055 ss-10]
MLWLSLLLTLWIGLGVKKTQALKVEVPLPYPYSGGALHPVNLTYEANDPPEFSILKFRLDINQWSGDVWPVKDFTSSRTIEIEFYSAQRLLLAAFLDPQTSQTNASLANALATSHDFRIVDPPSSSTSTTSARSYTTTRRFTTSTAPTSTSSSDQAGSSSSSTSSNTPAVIGLAVGLGVAVLIIAALIGYILLARKERQPKQAYAPLSALREVPSTTPAAFPHARAIVTPFPPPTTGGTDSAPPDYQLTDTNMGTSGSSRSPRGTASASTNSQSVEMLPLRYGQEIRKPLP